MIQQPRNKDRHVAQAILHSLEQLDANLSGGILLIDLLLGNELPTHRRKRMRDNYQTNDKENSEVQRVGVSVDFEELDNGTLTSSVVGKKSVGSGYTLALTDSCKSTMSADESRFDEKGDVNQPSSCPQRTQIIYGTGQFDFLHRSLPILRRIDRNVNLEEMSNVKFVCPGSNSHIFSAIWRNQSVIVKVT